MVVAFGWPLDVRILALVVVDGSYVCRLERDEVLSIEVLFFMGGVPTCLGEVNG